MICDAELPVCSDGSCVAACPPGTTNCSGSCANLNTDSDFCGSCQSSCGVNIPCELGVCVCAGGLTHCFESCQNLQASPTNCGACDYSCSGADALTPFCSAGTCVTSCDPDATTCGNGCTNLATDAENCGACGMQCQPLDTCLDGSCIPTCATGQSYCGTSCSDVASDPNNCGICGNACSGSAPACSSGICVAACPAHAADCSGACVDLSSDAAHCGSCGTSCAADEFCSSSTCQICPSGTVYWNGACQVGCVVAGSLYDAGTLEPLNPCEGCWPSVATNEWTPSPSGGSCDAGFCTHGACEPAAGSTG